MSDDELRMEAYYYSFDKTGVREIDLILSAVACAGKAYHHTDQWTEDCTWPGHKGETPVEWVQNAANAADAELAAERERADANYVAGKGMVEHVTKADAELAAERERADAIIHDAQVRNAEHEKDIERVAKLREALEFYANPENCTPALTSRVGAFTGIARAVLKETGSSEPGSQRSDST